MEVIQMGHSPTCQLLHPECPCNSCARDAFRKGMDVSEMCCYQHNRGCCAIPCPDREEEVIVCK